MRKLIAVMAAIGLASSALSPYANAEIVKSDAVLAGKNFCWSQGADSEQYGRDHTYVYSYLFSPNVQIVLHGVWTISRDGAVTLKIDGGVTLIRRYDIDGEHVVELTGSLGSGSDGHVC
jgi:hypothetical protein